MRNRAAHECDLAGPGYLKIADILTAPTEKALIFLAGNRRANAHPNHSFVLPGTSARGTYYSALMFAVRITLPHLSVSSTMNLRKSPADPISAVAPRSESRALILGSASAAFVSRLSLLTMSVGVLRGAPRADQTLASYPVTNSLTAGMSGSASERVMVVTAPPGPNPTIIRTGRVG